MNANISGLSIRYDVPSKCTVVESVLTKPFKTKKDQNEFILQLAESIQVNPVTIKMWCSKYSSTYTLGKSLPVGTMSHSFLTVPQDKVPEVTSALDTLKSRLKSLKEVHEIPNVPSYTSEQLRSRTTPQKLLNGLVTNSKVD